MCDIKKILFKNVKKNVQMFFGSTERKLVQKFLNKQKIMNGV